VQKQLSFPLKCVRAKSKIRLLLVDDQEIYIAKWREILDARIFQIEVARSADEALAFFASEQAISEIDLVISDISMHKTSEKGALQKLGGELAGMLLARKLRKLGYKNEIVLVSTGIDDFMGFVLCKLFLRFIGANWLVPKRTLLTNSPVFYRAYLL